MDNYETDLFNITSYFFDVLVNQFLKSEQYEHEESKKGVFGDANLDTILSQYSSIHPLVLETRIAIDSLPEKSGDYKALLIILKRSMDLFMELLEANIYLFNKLYHKSHGGFFSFKEFRKSNKLINKLRKKMTVQLYSLEVMFDLFNKAKI